MADTSTRKTTCNKASLLGFCGRIAAAAGQQVGSRLMLRALFTGVLISAAALEAIRFGIVERPMPLTAAYQSADPVVASVGRDVLRVSDAFAHAAFIGEEEVSDVPALIAKGTVDDAADHLALAQAARDAGLDESLDIRAVIALAERQILAEAYLEQITADAVSEEAIRLRYDEERAALTEDGVVLLSSIIVPTLDEAKALQERLPRTSFARLAQEAAKKKAAHTSLTEEKRLGELPATIAEAVDGLPVGSVTDPIAIDGAFAVVKVEARRSERLLPYEERRDAIVQALKAEALETALERARERSPLRVRTAEAILAETEAPGGRLASVRR